MYGGFDRIDKSSGDTFSTDFCVLDEVTIHVFPAHMQTPNPQLFYAYTFWKLVTKYLIILIIFCLGDFNWEVRVVPKTNT